MDWKVTPPQSDFPLQYHIPLWRMLKFWRDPYTSIGRSYDDAFPVAWLGSNCNLDCAGRGFYVAELMKHIGVASYGQCMHTHDIPGDPGHSAGQEFSSNTLAHLRRHRFYLAIENSNCDYWVTEKLTHAYEVGAIPLVDGPEDYSPYIPNDHRYGWGLTQG